MSSTIRLEDNFEDVMSKAASGLGVGNLALGESTGLEVDRIRAIMKGRVDDAGIAALAPPLGLHGPSLVELAHRRLKPDPVDVDGLHLFTTPYPVPGYEEMTVNSYLVVDPATGKAAAFDSGADAGDMLEAILRLKATVENIFLTHTHADHIADIGKLLAETRHPGLWAHEKEPFNGARSFESGHVFTIGELEVETRLTSGHSPGGTTYVIRGPGRPVAMVGDALFCCSQGGARGAYQLALQNNREQILSLPDETVLCPGHGPMTTVGWEKAHNPFFPEYK